MKKINFNGLREKNEYQIDYFLGGLNMEFIKKGDNWMIKNSNGRIVTDEEKLKLEKNELILEDMKSNKCQEKTTEKIAEINKELSKKGGKRKKTKELTKEEVTIEIPAEAPVEEEVEVNENTDTTIKEAE